MGIGTFISSMLALFIALVIVLGLAWGVIWLLRKWQDQQSGMGSRNPGQSIIFHRSLPLGQRERVTMISVHGEMLLLGVTAGGISLLARWPDDPQSEMDMDDGGGEEESEAKRKFSLAKFPALRSQKKSH